MLTSALLTAVKAVAFIAMLAFAGRAFLRVVFGAMLKERVDPWSALAAGVLAFYLAVMLVRDIGASMALLGAIAAPGAWLWWQERALGPASRLAWWELIAMALLCVLVVADPLAVWDARSIWFYHAKVVFHHGLDTSAWAYVAREASFSHPYYPKLVPVLGGAIAWIAGFWNDQLPKLALAVLLLPALVLGSRLFPGWRLRALFWVIALVTVRRYMWTGYMDGLLALWSGVALLHVVAGLAGAVERERALVVTALALAICISLKVEGWVITLAFIAALVAARVLAFRRGTPTASIVAYARALALVAAPYLLWRWYCAQASLGEGWGVLSGAYLERAMTSLTGPEFGMILDAMFRRSVLFWLACSLGVLAWVAWRRPQWRASLAAGALVLLLYGCALLFAYAGTPNDLQYQLASAASRTMLPLRLWSLALLLAAVAAWTGAWRRPEAAA